MRKSPRVTIMVHRDGALESRSLRVPLWLLRTAATMGAVLGVIIVAAAIAFAPIARMASRVPALNREIDLLRRENSQVRELAATLGRLEQTYSQVRTMMGGEILGERPLFFLGSLPVARAIHAAAPGSNGTRDPDPARPLTWPLPGVGFVTGEHVEEGGGTHPGMDIAVSVGTPIRAAASGAVAEAGVDSVYGRYVLMDHADRYQTMYGHMSRALVSAGDSVVTGQVVGLTGSTGRSTAPHLHFEVRLDGRSVDPRLVIEEVP